MEDVTLFDYKEVRDNREVQSDHQNNKLSQEQEYEKARMYFSFLQGLLYENASPLDQHEMMAVRNIKSMWDKGLSPPMVAMSTRWSHRMLRSIAPEYCQLMSKFDHEETLKANKAYKRFIEDNPF